MLESQILSQLVRVLSFNLLIVAIVVTSSRIGVHKHYKQRDNSPPSNHLINLNNSSQGVECGSHTPRRTNLLTGRVSNGYDAIRGEFPSFVEVRYIYGNYYNSCGGTIISEWLVLTAAHCFDVNSTLEGKTKVIAGSVRPNSGQVYWAERTCIPDEAHTKQWGSFDYALLILKKPIEFNEFVQPACIPWFDIDYRTAAYAVGFGLSQKKPVEVFPTKLQVLPVRRLPCPYSQEQAGKNTICFISSDPYHQGDTCSGDSGGPIYATKEGRQTLVGSLSRGIGICQRGWRFASINMDIAKLYPKISDTLDRCQQSTQDYEQ